MLNKLKTAVPQSRKKMPMAEILDREMMWLDAFGLLKKERLKPNAGVWVPEEMEEPCIRDPEVDKVQGCHFDIL
jgi:hypothetical protein